MAALSFLFFLLCLVFYIAWQELPFFVLAIAFLIVQIITMIGWWMQKRNAVSIYANGLVYRKRSLFWNEIAEVETLTDGGLKIDSKDGDGLLISASIQSLDRIAKKALAEAGLLGRS